MPASHPPIRSRPPVYFRDYRQLIAVLLTQGVERDEFRPVDILHTTTLFAALEILFQGLKTNRR